jgi:hypothetical protein
MVVPSFRCFRCFRCWFVGFVVLFFCFLLTSVSTTTTTQTQFSDAGLKYKVNEIIDHMLFSINPLCFPFFLFATSQTFFFFFFFFHFPKVRDISLAEWGRKEISLCRVRDARPDGLSQEVRRRAAAEGRSRHGLAAHDDSDGRADRDAEGARCAMCAGARATSSRRRTTPLLRSPSTAPGVRVEGRDRSRSTGAARSTLLWENGELGPQLIVDDGGDLTLLIHRGYAAEKTPSILDDDEGSEELAIVNRC